MRKPGHRLPGFLKAGVYCPSTCAGGETYYARHKDNDDSYQVPKAEQHNNPAWAGPPGQRIRDRAVTSIIYLNKDWDADRDGGCLRLFHTDGRLDVARCTWHMSHNATAAIYHLARSSNHLPTSYLIPCARSPLKSPVPCACPPLHAHLCNDLSFLSLPLLYHMRPSKLPCGQFTDVAPESGRLVVFQACAVEHEVLPAFRQRWAMTAWVPTLKSFQE
eukprot:1159528-Pelagomonas_calceolata.AAC.8